MRYYLYVPITNGQNKLINLHFELIFKENSLTKKRLQSEEELLCS